MAKLKRSNIRPIEGDWLARDGEQWRVRIPTHTRNGHKVFPFASYGGMQGAYKKARTFQAEMLKLLTSEKEYYAKYGEWPESEPKLHMHNKTGVRGVSKMVVPNRYQQPLIVYSAYWGPMRNRKRYSVSTAQYPETECLRLAKLAREYETTHPETLLKINKRKKVRRTNNG